MSPTDDVIAADLAETARRMYFSDERDLLTVNEVRTRVETKHKLEPKFFKADPQWNTRSKTIIKEAVDAFEQGANPSQSAPSSSQANPENGASKPSKKGDARTVSESPQNKAKSTTSAKPKPKPKQKPARKPKPKPKPKTAAAKKNKKRRIDSDEEESEASLSDSIEISDLEDDPPTPKRGSKGSKKRKVASSDEEEEEDSEPQVKKKAKAPPKSITAVPPKAVVVEKTVADSDTGSLSDVPSEALEDPNAAGGGIEDDESELSDVIDEPPKPKRKSKGASEPSKRASKAKQPAKESSASVTTDDGEVKKLQSQLVKCGIRKIWAFELKQYGDNSKAKIRHLKNMLKDIGMDGRFSEARAREIKERRELEADLEAVTEMNKNWGVGGARASRSRAAKSMKEASDNDEGDQTGNQGEGAGEDTDEDADANPKTHGRGSAKYRADLAFLDDDDDDESDSD